MNIRTDEARTRPIQRGRPRGRRRLRVSSLLLPLLVGAIPTTGAAQTPQSEPRYLAPRTSFGHPSLEGVWTHNFIIVMESSSRTPMLTLPEAEARSLGLAIGKSIGDQLDRALDPEVPALMQAADGLPIVRGERRTRVVVDPPDGRIPYTPAARRESSSGGGPQRFDHPEERPNWERCITSLGLPPVTGVGTTSANPRMFVQTPDHVVLFTEYGGEARIIPFTPVHKPTELHTSLGDSIAWWEGETLVVETIGLPEHDRVRAFSNLVVTSKSRVEERFTRVSVDELLYEYTVEDPAIYSSPWRAEYSLYQTSQRMFEHACHEGNYSLPNILKGERVKNSRETPPPGPAPQGG
jgi:hypothetical protein